MDESRQHATLSASSAHRWLSCTPSAKMEESYGLKECSVYAEEGTAAHRFAEIKLSYYFGKISIDEYDRLREEFMADESLGKWYSPEFEAYVNTYVDFVLRESNGVPNDKVFFEVKVDFSNIVPDGFGTSDTIIVKKDEIHIIDLKFGKGVPVSAHDNPQLRLYGFGALNMFPTVDRVRMSIVQPRLDSIDADVIDKKSLVEWGFTYVRPRAEQAIAGEGEFHASESACRFCKVKGQCKARADMMLSIAKNDFREPTPLYLSEEKSPPVLDYMRLPPEKIGEILTLGEEFVDWYKDVQAYALGQLVRGVKIPGYKLVEGRSARVVTDENALIEALKESGFADEDIVDRSPKLHSISQLEALVGKKKFASICGEYIAKPRGKLSMAPESDRRPAVESHALLEAEFAESVE